MICVFLSFMLGENRVIKEFGLSLASAVFLDAVVVRCLLLPAVLSILGERTWRIPAWLDRALPRVNIEGSGADGRRRLRTRRQWSRSLKSTGTASGRAATSPPRRDVVSGRVEG